MNSRAQVCPVFLNIWTTKCLVVVDCTPGACSRTCGGGEQVCERSCSNGHWGQVGCEKEQRFRSDTCNEQSCPGYNLWAFILRLSQCLYCDGADIRTSKWFTHRLGVRSIPGFRIRGNLGSRWHNIPLPIPVFSYTSEKWLCLLIDLDVILALPSVTANHSLFLWILVRWRHGR